jgi:two-component system cell cycle response regulator
LRTPAVIDKQYEELKLTGNLPTPNGVGLALLRAMQREDVSLDEVVEIVQSDPTLTGRILKLANGAALGGAQRVSTVREAAARLGLRTVRNVSLGFSLLAGNRGGRCKSFDYDAYWSHSLATGVAAKAIAQLGSGVNADEAFTLGLLSGIGRLALASVHPTTYGQILELAQGGSSQRLAEIEQECLGIHHRELAAALMQDWHLPQRYADVVALVGSGRDAVELEDPQAAAMARVLQSARDLARAMTTPSDAPSATCRKRRSELEDLCERLRLDEAGLERLWTKVAESWRHWGDTMRVRAQPQMSVSDLRAAALRLDVERGEAPVPGSALADATLGLGDGHDASSGLRILLALREPAARRALAAQLESDGHTTFQADEGQAALALALDKAPHVLVTEWELPGLSGPDLVHALRQGDALLRVHAILLTDASQEAHTLQAFESGIDEYLGRPCDPRVLQARVRAAQRVARLDERVGELLREREAQISQLAIAKRKLHTMVHIDLLTGQHNRRYAMERMQREVDAAKRNGTPLSVMMVDIDRFKAVNDLHGHDVGDAVLREVALALRASLRSIDALCRLGGEEFLVICPGTVLTDASRVAERLCSVARENTIDLPGFQRPVTISIGVACLADSTGSVDALLKQADERVYLAKQSGRDRVVAAGPPPPGARRAS